MILDRLPRTYVASRMAGHRQTIDIPRDNRRPRPGHVQPHAPQGGAR